MNSIEYLLDIPKRNYDRIFLIDAITNRTLTFGNLYEDAIKIAYDLQKRGFKKGDRVAVFLHNSSDFAKLYFALLYAGLVAVPINPALVHREVHFVLHHSGAKLLIVSPETVTQLDSSALMVIGIKILLLLDKRNNNTVQTGLETWDFDLLLSPKDAFIPFNGITPDDTMAIVYTSGTTGVPSGVVHRIENIIEDEKLFAHKLGIGPQNRFYGILAMTYLGGYHNLLLLPYTAQASVVLSNAFDAKSSLNFWQIADKHGVNTLWLVPTIMSILIEMDRGKFGESFCRNHIKLALVGTAPLPSRLRKDFEKRYRISLYENYGLSETLFITTNSPSLPVIDGSVGRVLPGVQVLICNSEGKPLPCEEEGEIMVCTPHLMQGYYNPDKKEVDHVSWENWFATGDIGFVSSLGDLFITGRKKDLIIRGGANISPSEIENVLFMHKSVAECAVVGVPHPLYGEDIVATIHLKPGYVFSEQEAALFEMCKNNLARNKQPSRIIEIEEYPRSSTGKIQKNKVRELLKTKLGLSEIMLHEKPAKTTINSSAMLPGRVRRNIVRPSQEILKTLSKYPSSIISDCMNRLGAMDGSIHSLVPTLSFCGSALTIEEVEGGNLMSHIALEIVQPGDVLVIDAKGTRTRSCWGGLQTLMAKNRGAVGVVIFGSIRDLEKAKEIGMPVFGVGTSPAGPLKGWGGYVNYPISCCGLAVHPGDIIVGDDDGVVVVPHDIADHIAGLCAERIVLEQQWFERVKAGESTLDVVNLRSKIQELNIDIRDK